MITLRTPTWRILVEALRRRSRFTSKWSGLGCKSDYWPAKRDGYMEPAFPGDPKPRIMCWWKLTERGNRVVAYWLGQGYDHIRIEAGDFPPSRIPAIVVED